MPALSFWCCTTFALQPLHCISWIIERRNNYEICETAAEICSESVKKYEYVFPCELNALCQCAISGISITGNFVSTRIVGGKQFVQVYVRAAVHCPSEIVYYF